MKVLLVAPLPPPYGGIANWTKLITEFSKKTDVDLCVLNTAPKKRGVDGRSFRKRLLDGGVSMPKTARALLKAVRKSRPDVIHIATSGKYAVLRDILLLKLAKRKQIPAVYHFHFGKIKVIANDNTREWHLLKRAIGLADMLLPIDGPTYETLRREFPEKPCVFMPNPFDVSGVQPAGPAACTKTVLYLGWVVPHKGVGELISAWRELETAAHGWTLSIVGPQRADFYESLAKDLPQGVQFLGELPHEAAMEVMRTAGIFVLPSYTEGFPNVVLEAMAYAKPVVATDVGAIPEMLSGCGVVVPKKDSHALGTALLDLMVHEEKRIVLGEAARKKAEREYDLGIVFCRLEEVWRNLAN